ncbi:MAG TPA: GAF domain-containing sensor histidine kinase [Thermomicrobiales bacterium]|nr:GAF domain-containing sensor histidine kinase [Thermomicrobiales bacterium]
MSLDFGSSLESMVELARRLVRSRRASLMLPGRDTAEELHVAAASGLPAEIASAARVRLGDPVSGIVAQTRRPLLVNERGRARARGAPEALAARTVRPPRRPSYRTGSFISVPVPIAGMGYGVLNVADPVKRRGFGRDDLESLQSFAGHIAHELAYTRGHHNGDLRWRVIQAQEEERRRIARELHDEAGHALAAAIFHLDLETVKLPTGADSAQEALQDARDTLMDCTAMLHDIAFALRPRILEDLGLAAALRSLTSRARASSGLDMTLTIAGEERPLPEALELAVFRVVQEALTNVLKHARATVGSVILRYGPASLVLVVADNGVGLRELPGAGAASALARPSLGLGGLRERVAMLGGTLEVGAAAPGGTQLTVTLPLDLDGTPPAK